MKIIIVLFLLFLENAYAQYGKYYSDEVGSGSGSGILGILFIIGVFVFIFVISSNSTRRSLIYFLALFGQNQSKSCV